MGFFDWLSSGPEFARTGSNPADLVLVNGRVLTSDPGGRRVEAFAVRGGRFVYVGAEGGVGDYVGPDTEVIDAKDRVVTPGFIDSHCHLLWIGALGPVLSQDLYFCKDFDKATGIIRAHADRNPDLPFVFCMGWEQDLVPGGVVRKEDLDAVIPDRPLILWSECAHRGWVNSAALEHMRERNPKVFEQLYPVIGEDGEPTGEFLTFWFIDMWDFFTWDEIGEEMREKMLAGMADAVKMSLSLGVTAVDDVMVHRPFIPTILEFRRRGGFDDFRARGTFYVNHHMVKEEEWLRSFLAEWKDLGERESDARLVLGESIKMGTDGVAANHTAYLLEPYSDMPDSRGESSWTQEDFNRVVEIADGLGLQVCTHACGDAAIRMAVNGYESVAPAEGGLAMPHRVDHCSMPAREDIPRMGRLGICAAMQPTHFVSGPTDEKSLGPERIATTQPFRSLADAGVLIGFGSDYCAGPLNPVYGLLVAATRINYRMKVEWGPDEKIDIETAIRHWTIDSAKTMLMDAEIGSIEVGKQADFAVFGTDPLKLDSWWFLLTHKLEVGAMDDFVDLTYVGGKQAFRKE
ncbi:MAG: amidohydrolase [Actinobacteria bacterium]|jgi:predicted amidohydrolase YtcJ|nr:MAG: amidohydrolase [Actinomycetota bacterium]